MRIAIALATALLALPRPATACSCIEPPPPAVALQRAAAVFEGTAIAAIASDDGSKSSVGFRVARRWKGPTDETISVVTPSSPASCGFVFQSGQAYLVYADTMQGQLATSLCSRTRPLDLAADDLAALGPPLAAPSGDTVATRPAPPMLDTREPVRPQDGGGCACTSKGHAEYSAAGMIPVLLFGLRRTRRARPSP